MLFFDRLLSLFGDRPVHAQGHGPAAGRVHGAGSRAGFEPVEVQMAREMDEFDGKQKGAIRERDIADACEAIRGGMPVRHVRSMYGQAVLALAQASLKARH